MSSEGLTAARKPPVHAHAPARRSTGRRPRPIDKGTRKLAAELEYDLTKRYIMYLLARNTVAEQRDSSQHRYLLNIGGYDPRWDDSKGVDARGRPSADGLEVGRVEDAHVHVRVKEEEQWDEAADDNFRCEC